MTSDLPEILLVDDEPEALFLTQRQLRRGGVTNPVVGVGSGREAIAHLQRVLDAGPERAMPPCLVLLDVKMPELTGFDVLEWIRAQPRFEHLRVMMLSSSDDPNDLKRARRLGAREYLLKYPAPETLARIAQSAQCQAVVAAK